MEKVKYRTPEELKKRVEQDKKNLKKLFERIKKIKSKKLDALFLELHREAFQQFNCLHCANCCSAISPIITGKDIDKLAHALRIKPAHFIEKYLQIDEDSDYVFNHVPCPFLLPDNYCMVYENRPKACRGYPHTDRRKMQQILKITLKNCEICPVVYTIVQEIKKVID